MERDRFWAIAGILFLIFLIFMGVVVWKADALTKNACQLCAEKMGEEVVCTTGGQTGHIITRTYYPNFTIIDGGS
jgi:hypothetical protein